MVLVNGKEFKIFRLDTKENILERLAAEMNTLPKYLYFPDGFPEDLSEDFTVKNILKIIKKNAKEADPDFSVLIKKLEGWKTGLDVKKDILPVWLVYNKHMHDMASYGLNFLETSAKKLEEFFPTFRDFTIFWEGRLPRIKEELEKQVEYIRTEIEKQIKIYDAFEEIEAGLVYTEYKIESTNLSFSLNLENISLLEIFNYICLNDLVPFCSCQKFYKILKSFVPIEEWNISYDNELLLKVFEKKAFDATRYNDYTNVKMNIDKGIVNVFLKLITGNDYLNQEEFIDRCLSVFTNRQDITVENIIETDVAGVFFFPDSRLDTYVFADLVMNNKLFSSLISIDESVKATKKKSSEGGQPWIYIHFEHPLSGHIAGPVSQRIVDRSDPEMKQEDIETFPHGNPYIRVKAKGKNKQSISFFQEILSKLLIIYKEEYNTIIKEYRKFIPDFGNVVDVIAPLKKKLTNMQAPEIFINGYTRICTAKRMPKIVTLEEKAEYEEKGQQCISFPREKGEGVSYPSDGRKPKYYVCPNPEYPFPGLQHNKLANSAEYPYVPCCFKQDQAEKKGGIFRHYYNREEIEVKEKRQQELIITNKILGSEKYGTLPEKLHELFQTVDPDTNYKYIRAGVHRNKSSFLNAVMVSLNDQTGILSLKTEKKRVEKLREIRKELSRPDLAPLARQCMYDYTTEQVSNHLKDEESYLDPKLYIQLLEEYFHCNIFLFSSDRMILPRFVQGYYSKKRKAPCVFIYEHMGSESDHATYPQCEFIVRWEVKKEQNIQYSFPYDQNISENVRKIDQLLKKSYILTTPMTKTKFSIENAMIAHQEIDAYGKTRRLDIEYKDTPMTIYTDPMAPLAVPDVKRPIHTVDSRIARELLNVVEKQNLSGSKLSEIVGKIGNVKVTIPVVGEVLPDVPISYEIYHPKEKESSLTIFNRNKKLARFLTEYIFWLFSRYLTKNKIEEINDKTLSKFSKALIKIIPDFRYGFVPKFFSLSSGLMDEEKLVVTSEEMLKRLLYVLKLYSIRDKPSLLTYHNRPTISQYYLDLEDFVQIPTQVILLGEDSMEKWLYENRQSMSLKEEIEIGKTPYFFKNENIENGKVFLAQNADSVQNALDIAIFWNKNGYNQGIHIDTRYEDEYAFNLYLYTNKSNIQKTVVPGKKKPEKEINILGYKLSDTPFFTVLLDLEK